VGLALAPAAGCARALRDDATRRHDDAARKGIQWIVSHRGDYPESFYSPYLRRFSRIAADDALAGQLFALAARAPEPVARCTPEMLSSDPGCRNWPALRAVLVQTYRAACSGRPSEREVALVREAVARHEAELVPPGGTASDRIVAAYHLGKLGIRPRDSREAVAAEIRREAAAAQPVTFESPGTVQLAMDLAHLVFTDSDYFARYVAASEHGPEAAAMRAIVGAALKADLSGFEVDAVAEVLSALKLLQEPDDDATRSLEDRLVALQNGDGSWGEDDRAAGCFGCRVHRTEVVSMALLAFAARPRGRDPWCEGGLTAPVRRP
jgi:hypothetical protein